MSSPKARFRLILAIEVIGLGLAYALGVLWPSAVLRVAVAVGVLGLALAVHWKDMGNLRQLIAVAVSLGGAVVVPLSAGADISHFTDNADGTVTDTEKGLTWEGAGGAARSYTRGEAEKYCSAKGDGWRLPTSEELLSLVDPSVPTGAGPKIDRRHFPGTRPEGYWVHTGAWTLTDRDPSGGKIDCRGGRDGYPSLNSDGQWRCLPPGEYVHFRDGGQVFVRADIDTNVRCVRGP